MIFFPIHMFKTNKFKNKPLNHINSQKVIKSRKNWFVNKSLFASSRNRVSVASRTAQLLSAEERVVLPAFFRVTATLAQPTLRESR